MNPDPLQFPELDQMRTRLRERLGRIAAGQREAASSLVPATVEEIERLEGQFTDALDRLRERKAALQSAASKGGRKGGG